MFSNFQIWQKIITYLYSCDKIITIQIQISRENWNYFFSNNGHHMMIYRTTIVFRAKIKWYKPKKAKKLILNSHLLTVQILTNDVQVLILCLSYLLLYYFCTYLNIYTIFARTHILWLDFFCWILSSIQIKYYLEEPDLKWPKFHGFLPEEKFRWLSYVFSVLPFTIS